ncbi:conserved hypothetical protein [Trichinella spiralis]|uniref:hypothetical protein n=1 Tax=Trichinella spiralis TaxID=6334 RepID=UPI0001EFDD7C|nr:conserved hypothetical protein [Trichinella spiralis]
MYYVEHPKFSETLLEFLSFWEQFTAGIHNNTEIADVTKFTYLRSLLEGGKFGGSSLYARTLICAWCSTKLAIVAIIEWSAFRSMFALEAAQAGFPADFKIAHLYVATCLHCYGNYLKHKILRFALDVCINKTQPNAIRYLNFHSVNAGRLNRMFALFEFVLIGIYCAYKCTAPVANYRSNTIQDMSGQRRGGGEWEKWERTKSDYPAVYVTENCYDKMMENPQLIRLHQLNEDNR